MALETVVRLGGGNWTYHSYSEMGQAAEEGATTGELAVGLKDGLVQSGKDLILREHDRAYYNGDITPEEWGDRQIASSSLLLGPKGGRALLVRGRGALSRATKGKPAFGSRAPWKRPLGEAKVRPGDDGTTYPAEPMYSKYNNWLLNKIPGLRWVEYPNRNYGVIKGLRNEAAVRAHELAHMDFIKNYPQVTHLAARHGYFPGKGIARTIIEFHGNLAEHKGNIGKALLGTLKDTDLVALTVDAIAALVLISISLKNRGER